jgi:hypothetical protein
MDTWSIAQLGLDLTFAVLIATLIAAFLYRRESKLRADVTAALAQAVVGGLEPEATEAAELSEQQPERPVSPAARVEKYLEAIRLYRDGHEQREIEKKLGISMVELELLGKVK